MDDKTCVIIVAAGKGKRMGSAVKKQFLKLNGKPILYYTLKAFENNASIDSIVLVCSEEDLSFCKEEIVEKFSFRKVKSIIKGGKERQQSVYNGLKVAISSKVVLIQDGARPFVTDEIIEKGIQYAVKYGSAACGVCPKDTIKLKDEKGFSVNTLDRDSLFSVQTPQCFIYDIILECHNKIMESNIKVTDDTSIVEYYGHKVFLYEGSYNNIKITTPEDLIIAEKILENMQID